MIKIRQAIGNFFASLGGAFREQTQKRIENLIFKEVGLSSKDLEGKTDNDKNAIIAKALLQKNSKSDLKKLIIGQLLTDPNGPYQIFVDAKVILDELFEQNWKTLEKLLKAESEEEEAKMENPLANIGYKLRLLKQEMEKAHCTKIEFDPHGMPVEDLARLLTSPNDKFSVAIVPIPNTDNGYITAT